jgi:hypothetical protein
MSVREKDEVEGRIPSRQKCEEECGEATAQWSLAIDGRYEGSFGIGREAYAKLRDS